MRFTSAAPFHCPWQTFYSLLFWLPTHLYYIHKYIFNLFIYYVFLFIWLIYWNINKLHRDYWVFFFFFFVVFFTHEFIPNTKKSAWCIFLWWMKEIKWGAGKKQVFSECLLCAKHCARYFIHWLSHWRERDKKREVNAWNLSKESREDKGWREAK